MTNPAIIVVTYNRPASLRRILESLSNADYAGQEVELVISIDYDPVTRNTDVLKIATEYEWSFGRKVVKHQEVNLGLRKHIMKCGALAEEYGAIVVLEDDIYVSPQFYVYTRVVLNRYDNDTRIAGISLYKHLWNVNVSRPFIAESDGNDVFFMQFAQSWGQCWSKRMWADFYQWYQENERLDLSTQVHIPEFVRGWSDRSWLKYFIAYVISSDKFFVYPHESLTTNFNDVGSHVKIANTISQVPIVLKRREYRMLPDFREGLKYDAFFERYDLARSLGVPGQELCTDLYASKGNIDKKRYWLTTGLHPYRVVKSYSLSFRPIESNVLLNNQGNDIFLYDTSQPSARPENKHREITDIMYDIRDLTIKKLFNLLVYKMKSKIR